MRAFREITPLDPGGETYEADSRRVQDTKGAHYGNGRFRG